MYILTILEASFHCSMSFLKDIFLEIFFIFCFFLKDMDLSLFKIQHDLVRRMENGETLFNVPMFRFQKRFIMFRILLLKPRRVVWLAVFYRHQSPNGRICRIEVYKIGVVCRIPKEWSRSRCQMYFFCNFDWLIYAVVVDLF